MYVYSNRKCPIAGIGQWLGHCSFCCSVSAADPFCKMSSLHVLPSASTSRFCAPDPRRVVNNNKLLSQRRLPVWKVIRHLPAAATNSSVEQPVASNELLETQATFAVPSKRHQPRPTTKERAALRSNSETLAKDKKLQRLQVGVQGITYNVLVACLDILMKHEYLRVKLGEGCGLERKQTAAMLADLLDAVVVGQVGFTITLYRQKGLPRPDNLVKATG